MVGLYEDFAYDGTEFNTFLAQDQFASGSSPEDFHVHSATEPHFPSSIHALKGHQPYLSPTDPLGPNLDNALQTAHLARSAPTSFPITSAGTNHHPPNLTLDTMGLAWNTAANTTGTPTTGTHPNTSSNLATNLPQTDDPTHLRTLLTALQSELRQTARERDEARMQLSTARNELYAARQLGKRLRVERDEARSQAEFLGQERVKLKQTETRLRRERNEARLAVLAGRGGKRGVGGMGGVGGVGGGGGGIQGESQGEESGGSPEVGVGMDQG
jgi:hypothetical protein